MEGKWSGAGPFTEGDKEYMAVYRKVIHMESFAAVPADEGLMKLMELVIGGPEGGGVLLHNRKIGRINFPKNIVQTTAAHQDFHYIRGTSATYTMWMPVGDCPVNLGGLVVLKGSHRQGYLEHGVFNVKKYAGHGLGEEKWPRGEGIEWQAGDFQLGDAIIFHSHTIHKAMPNLTDDRLRISIDNRYQKAGDAIEPGSMGTHYGF
jgi:ectoine hydroxylase-related dioxygenase (phytanoyl-CoA dioxygenase family)